MRTYSLTFQLMKMTYKPFARPSDDNEGCPVCDGLGSGPYTCPNCGRRVMDFDYFKSLKKMEEKYGTDDLHKLSCEKLTFKEIVAIRTISGMMISQITAMTTAHSPIFSEDLVNLKKNTVNDLNFLNTMS